MSSFDNILNQLQSLDIAQRSQAILQLQPTTGNDEAAIGALVGVLCGDTDLNIVEDATWVLGRYGTAATSALLAELTHLDARVRHNIVHALGKIADIQTLPALIHATEDVDTAVRLKAVYALGQIGHIQAIPALITRLDDPIQDIRWTAREVLQTFGAKAFDHLLDALQHASPHGRELAASLLGDIGDKRAVDPLLATLSTPDGEVRLAIVEALGAIGDKRALAPIERLAHDDYPPVRAMVKGVIKQLNNGNR